MTKETRMPETRRHGFDAVEIHSALMFRHPFGRRHEDFVIIQSLPIGAGQGLRASPGSWPNRSRVRVHGSGMNDKFRAELIDVAARGLTLIVQQGVFRIVRHISTMVVEVRALIGP